MLFLCATMRCSKNHRSLCCTCGPSQHISPNASPPLLYVMSLFFERHSCRAPSYTIIGAVSAESTAYTDRSLHVELNKPRTDRRTHKAQRNVTANVWPREHLPCSSPWSSSEGCRSFRSTWSRTFHTCLRGNMSDELSARSWGDSRGQTPSWCNTSDLLTFVSALKARSGFFIYDPTSERLKLNSRS